MQLLPPPGSHPSPLLSSHTCPTIPSSPPAPPLLCHHCSQIQAAWRTDEIRRRKPTPQDESREGLTYFHETIFAGLPVFLRRIDTALKNIGQPKLPLTAKLFSFGAWMGGDRDGNPFVTPETTRDVVIGARLRCGGAQRGAAVRVAPGAAGGAVGVGVAAPYGISDR